MKNLRVLALNALGCRVWVLVTVLGLLWPTVSFAQRYRQTNLVVGGNLPPRLVAAKGDPNLVNPWALARSTDGPWWVSANGTGTSTSYTANGQIQPLVVTIPGSPGSAHANPTGIVFNGSESDFAVDAAGHAAPFIFVSEDGSISGWNPNVPSTPGELSKTAIIRVMGSSQSVLKGATIAEAGDARFLYVADFKDGKIKIYNTNFEQVWFYPCSFVDPSLPPGFAPFNVQNIGGNLYVAFAKQDDNKQDEVSGPGLGFVDVFSPHGFLLMRLESGDWFNAPWGLALAPSDFGSTSHKLLVGQFGSGEILIFDPVTGRFKGKLNDQNNNAIQIQGLWAISFGSGTVNGTEAPTPAPSGPANTLFFTAGVNEEAGGLFGTLTPEPGDLIQGNGQ
jgi:uncharacterized protein (TIGR03118 family)